MSVLLDTMHLPFWELGAGGVQFLITEFHSVRPRVTGPSLLLIRYPNISIWFIFPLMLALEICDVHFSVTHTAYEHNWTSSRVLNIDLLLYDWLNLHNYFDVYFPSFPGKVSGTIFLPWKCSKSHVLWLFHQLFISLTKRVYI